MFQAPLLTVSMEKHSAFGVFFVHCHIHTSKTVMWFAAVAYLGVHVRTAANHVVHRRGVLEVVLNSVLWWRMVV